jgi:hypothetical protein
MPTFFAKFLLFISAYIPLVCLLMAKIGLFCFTVNLLVILGIFLLAVVLVWLLLRTLTNNVNSTSGNFEITGERSSEVLSYLLSYAIPFFIEVNGANDYLFLLLYFAFLFTVYVNSDLIKFNLIFTVLGYRIYDVKTGGKEGFVIHKGLLSSGEYDLKSYDFIKPNIWLTYEPG